MAINVTIWNEFIHERNKPEVAAIHPNGIHNTIRSFIESDDVKVTCVTLDMEENGLTDEILNNTDVLIWWGHVAHARVSDEVAEKVRQRVYAGMGFIPLHSAHHSKPFKLILGTTGNLSWGRNQHGIVWNVNPTHPIAQGIPSHFDIYEEMYGEPFFIPKPDDLIFATWYEDGNIFRGGATFTRGLGKIFYFHTGHEDCRSFMDVNVQRIINNAIKWCSPIDRTDGFVIDGCIHQTEPIFNSKD